MKQHQFLNVDWQQILSENNLNNFDSIWNLKTEWFEEPNIRRGGWSGVVKIDLDTPQGKVGVFIKRQENHITKTPLHPIEGIPTFEREFKNILQLRKDNIPTLEPVYFSKRNHKGDLQAILITKELAEYIPLDSNRFLTTGDLIKDTSHKNRLIKRVAETIGLMHHHHFQHNCLYLKHIFIKPDGDSWDVKIIDLEKLKKTIFKRSSVFRDLYTLSRHSIGWSTKDYVAFFQAYFQEEKLSDKSKSLWRAIARKILLKRR
jgi:tRNA A-37 threonylcarbamoyl transferase component Bud32